MVVVVVVVVVAVVSLFDDATDDDDDDDEEDEATPQTTVEHGDDQIRSVTNLGMRVGATVKAWQVERPSPTITRTAQAMAPGNEYRVAVIMVMILLGERV